VLQYGYMQKMAIDELSLEREIKENFSVCTEIGQMILFNVPVGRSVHASLFLAEKKQLYLYIKAQAKLNLGDVKRIVSRMGLKADILFNRQKVDLIILTKLLLKNLLKYSLVEKIFMMRI